MSNDVRSLINHYAQLGFSRHIQTVCREVVKKRGRDPVLGFWEAFGVAQEGGITEAIRNLEGIRGKRDTDLAAVHAMVHFHKQSRIVDHEAVSALEREMGPATEAASPTALHLAATFYWHVDNLVAARKLVDRILGSDPSDKSAQTLRGWIDLSSAGCSGSRGKDNFEKSVHWFENALEGEDPSRKQLAALMGRAKYYEIKCDFEKALESLNEVMVIYSWFLPALTEKARILIKTGDYDQGVELAKKVLEQDSFDLESQRLLVFELLNRQSNPSMAAATLTELMESMDRYEPKNAGLYYRVSQPFARLAGRSRQILELTLAMVDRARSLDRENSLYAAEYGYQQALLGEYGAAAESYRRASKLDESNVSALAGMIHCQIAEGAFEDAEQQLELFRMIQESIGRTSELAFLDALLAWRKARNASAQEAALDETCRLHWAALRDFRASGPKGADLYTYFSLFNPEFLLDVAKEYLQGYGSSGTGGDGAPTPTVSKGTQLLERVTTEVPGHIKAQLLLAKIKYAAGDTPGSVRTLNTCLRLDPTYSDAHLLMASIGLAQDNHAMADAALERALSHNFQVRDSPVFHRIKAKVLATKGDLDGALTVLEDAMRIPGVKQAAKGSVLPVSINDRASIFIQLAEVLTQLDRIDEATKVVSDALHQFTGTEEEVRVVVANSQIALRRGKVDSAIRMLGNVPFDSPAFAKAQMVKADIYLKHRHDRRLFIKCYEDIVEKNKSEHAYVMLGDAYMRIQMPVEATRSFEEALSRAPDNASLASKVGRALIATHDYRRAVEYYEEALERDRRAGGHNVDMRSDLTQLFVKLRRFDEAARLLDEALSSATATSEVASMSATRDNLLLLARVHKGTGNHGESIAALLRALELQNKVIMRLRSTNPDLLQEQREEAAKLCHTLAQAHLEAVPPQEEKAVLYLSEALKALESHEPSLLALATLRLQRGELDACEGLCGTLLKHDPKNEQASIMLADIMFRKNEADRALFHFTELLEKHPGHYGALYKLINLLKRAGKLSDAPRFLRLAERHSPRAEHDAGLKFCKGVYHRYNAEDHEAIKMLNQVRLSGDWGLMATEHMIEIYLSPERPTLWSETAASEASEAPADNAEACRVAEKLLRDIAPSLRTTRHQVYEAYVLIVSMNRTNVEQGIQHLGAVLSENSSDVRALLALATALMVLRQMPKARNQLKRIAKMPYNSELADQFVQAYLLLADVYIGTGKYDLAQDYLQKALSYDKSCAKAWEYMGLIMEKEAAYKDAAENYEQAFLLQNEASASVGFKLAFNFLKAERFVEAIDVAHKVLALYPDYPRIRKEILLRARESLRR